MDINKDSTLFQYCIFVDYLWRALSPCATSDSLIKAVFTISDAEEMYLQDVFGGTNVLVRVCYL